MKEYKKIETVFERDSKTKRLTDVYRNPDVWYLRDNQWIFTEKVDGTNIRVYWDGHGVSFAGRTDKAEIPPRLLETLNGLFGGELNEEMFEQKFGGKEAMLFGEGYGGRIQAKAYTEKENFILFDVMIERNYQPRLSVEDVAEYFGIDCVPIAMTGTVEQAIKYVERHPKSLINPELDMEGVVGHPTADFLDRCGNRVAVKVKYADFEHKGKEDG